MGFDDEIAGGVIKTIESVFADAYHSFGRIVHLFVLDGYYYLAVAIYHSALAIVVEYKAVVAVEFVDKLVLRLDNDRAVFAFESEKAVALGCLDAVDKVQLAATGFIVDNNYVVAFVCLCLKAGKGDAKK